MLFDAGTYVSLLPRLQAVFKSMTDLGKVMLAQITGTPVDMIVALAVGIGIALEMVERRRFRLQVSS